MIELGDTGEDKHVLDLVHGEARDGELLVPELEKLNRKIDLPFFLHWNCLVLQFGLDFGAGMVGSETPHSRHKVSSVLPMTVLLSIAHSLARTLTPSLELATKDL